MRPPDHPLPWFGARKRFAPPDVARRDRIVALVGKMLDLNKRLATAAPHEKEVLARTNDATDREIDRTERALLPDIRKERGQQGIIMGS
ncbi:MAG: hypothetical protein PWQ30_1999 [Euryarchaeota archaeon]|jgi:hypothetical protein|nr:hypothetical protein [Euryarchaeota archaeon]